MAIQSVTFWPRLWVRSRYRNIYKQDIWWDFQKDFFVIWITTLAKNCAAEGDEFSGSGSGIGSGKVSSAVLEGHTPEKLPVNEEKSTPHSLCAPVPISVKGGALGRLGVADDEGGSPRQRWLAWFAFKNFWNVSTVDPLITCATINLASVSSLWSNVKTWQDQHWIPSSTVAGTVWEQELHSPSRLTYKQRESIGVWWQYLSPQHHFGRIFAGGADVGKNSNAAVTLELLAHEYQNEH